jgi:hypothetical protein
MDIKEIHNTITSNIGVLEVKACSAKFTCEETVAMVDILSKVQFMVNTVVEMIESKKEG